jgi:hypothetical protein
MRLKTSKPPYQKMSCSHIITNKFGHITKLIGHCAKASFWKKNSERVLIFLLTRHEGYAREIAQLFDTNLYAIQRQLDKLESGGVLVSRADAPVSV